MSAGAALHWLLSAAGGVMVVGLVRVPLRIEERCALAVVAGVCGGAALSLLLALPLGMTAPALLLGPVVLGLGALAVAGGLRLHPLRPWAQTLSETRARRREPLLWWMAGLTVVAAVGFSIAFAHAFFDQNGNIMAGYSTVWADWSLHSTSASSFAVGHNLPPQDPVFAGTAYRYPFLADFHAGELMALGGTLNASLEVPAVVLCVAVTVLVVSLAVRVKAGFAAGVIAMAICLMGGGLGAGGMWWDACARHGDLPDQCAPSQMLVHPVTAVEVLSAVPSVIRDQQRAYDNLLQDQAHRPVGNIQWYTPLMAWWFPQRTFVFGFALAVGALLLVAVALERGPPAWSPFLVAGALAGLLPLVHVHSLIALVIALPLVALVARRREWWGMAAVAAVVAVPRIVQLAGGGHGVENGPYGSDVFPYLEPGWLWGADQGTLSFSASGFGQAAVRTVRTVFTPGFWGFWVLNWGLVVPLCGVLALGVAARRARGRAGDVAGRVAGAVPAETLRLALPLLAIFAVANVVVFQEWDWDNTKLFAYAYLGAALLVGAWASRWWAAGGLRGVTAALTVGSLLVTGVVVMMRFLPWTPVVDSQGPYVWASADDRTLADTVARLTPPGTVALTGGRPNDPLLTLGGRLGVMGYVGWLQSYGTDFGTRPADVATIYRGCADPTAPCRVPELLARYHVGVVELGAYERDNQHADQTWWSQHYPVLAQAGDTTVYDVRRP